MIFHLQCAFVTKGIVPFQSPELRRYREQVQVLESRLYQLMDKLVRNADNEASVSVLFHVTHLLPRKIHCNKAQTIAFL
jgi:uncharacterized protein YigA (DUF484 family)